MMKHLDPGVTKADSSAMRLSALVGTLLCSLAVFGLSHPADAKTDAFAPKPLI